MRVMLYPCILCVAMCLGVVAILLLNVMEVFSVGVSTLSCLSGGPGP